MRHALLPLTAFLLTASPAFAEPILCQGYQCPKVPVVQPGYVTKDGKRYGNCRNYHHRPHKHCKELRDVAPTNTPQKR